MEDSKKRKTKARQEAFGALLSNNLYYDECREVLKDLLEEFQSAPYINKIPDYQPTFEEISKQLRINCDCIKKEVADHVDLKIKRFQDEIKSIQKKLYYWINY